MNHLTEHEEYQKFWESAVHNSPKPAKIPAQ